MKQIIIFFIGGMLLSCSGKTKEEASKEKVQQLAQAETKAEKRNHPIYLSTYTSFKKTNGEMGMDTKLSKVTDEYFEIELKVMGDHKTYQAGKDIESLVSTETLHSVSIGITDDKSNPLTFNSSTEFLNFMSDHGYEMKDQHKKKYSISYTFKRK